MSLSFKQERRMRNVLSLSLGGICLLLIMANLYVLKISNNDRQVIDKMSEDLQGLYNDLGLMNYILNSHQRAFWAVLKRKKAHVSEFEVTAYDAYGKRSINVEKWRDGKTALNRKAIAGQSIAVDPKVIPFDSRVYIPGMGWRIAEDVGGAIKGYKIDVLMPSEQAAMKFGRKRLQVAWVPPESD